MVRAPHPATAAHFASWNGTAPIEASSGDRQRHRLSGLGNRRINRVLRIMAIVQLRHDTAGRAYHRRRPAEGKTTMEAAWPPTACRGRVPSDSVPAVPGSGVVADGPSERAAVFAGGGLIPAGRARRSGTFP